MGPFTNDVIVLRGEGGERGLQIMTEGRGSLAVDDVTFYRYFLELNF